MKCASKPKTIRLLCALARRKRIRAAFSEGMLNKARETLRDCDGIEYRLIDIQEIPFADHSFDTVHQIPYIIFLHISNFN